MNSPRSPDTPRKTPTTPHRTDPGMWHITTHRTHKWARQINSRSKGSLGGSYGEPWSQMDASDQTQKGGPDQTPLDTSVDAAGRGGKILSPLKGAANQQHLFCIRKTFVYKTYEGLSEKRTVEFSTLLGKTSRISRVSRPLMPG